MDYPYEKLDVWKKALDFNMKILTTVANNSKIKQHQMVARALEESATSIATGIAEGKSYPSGQDFSRHLYRSRGGIYKTMTLLKQLTKQKIIPGQQYTELDEAAQRLTAMLSALIKSISNKNSEHAKKSK